MFRRRLRLLLAERHPGLHDALLHFPLSGARFAIRLCAAAGGFENRIKLELLAELLPCGPGSRHPSGREVQNMLLSHFCRQLRQHLLLQAPYENSGVTIAFAQALWGAIPHALPQLVRV